MLGSDDPYAAWKRWKRSFMVWMTGTEQLEKSDAVKVNLMLACLGADGQDVFETFDLPDDVSLEAVLGRFDDYWRPRSNVVMSRFRFFSLVQQPEMRWSEFITLLKTVANDCLFGDLKDDLISTMIVLRCSDNDLRCRLLREPGLTLDRVVELTKLYEETKRNVDMISPVVAESDVDVVDIKKYRCASASVEPVKRAGFAACGERFFGRCFGCGRRGHRAADCKDKHQRAKVNGVAAKTQPRTCGTKVSGDDGSRVMALSAVVASSPRRKGWHVDCSVSSHMTGDERLLKGFVRFDRPKIVHVGRKRLLAYGTGEVHVDMRVGKHVFESRLVRTLWVPMLRRNLFSVFAVERRGLAVKFEGCKMRVVRNDGHVCAVGSKIAGSGLFTLDIVV
jgi:hypothetical protein